MNDLEKMIEVNKKQKKYYELDPTMKKAGNLPTKIWRNLRRKLQDIRNKLGAEELIIKKHRFWLGDIGNKSILDLGCFSGNILSLELAKKSKSYLGVDLSESATLELKTKLNNAGIQNADTRAVDFLSEEFSSEQFDVIYMWGVAHHFENFEILLEKLDQRLKPGGCIITLDPMETYFPAKLLRMVYRPFQSDSDWEYPFNKKNFKQIDQTFTIKNIHGIMGKSKWAFPVSFISSALALRLGKKWQNYDEAHMNNINSKEIWSCLMVSLHLIKNKV